MSRSPAAGMKVMAKASASWTTRCSAQRLPSNLQRPFAASQMSLLVPAAFDQPLPAKWHVQQLPLRVRFRQDWWRTLGLRD